MIQAILAIILLVCAVGFYLWGRRSTGASHCEDPDVILGLTEPRTAAQSAAPVVAEPKIEPVAETASATATVAAHPTWPLQREILLLRAPASRQYGGYELLQSLLSCGLYFGENQIFHRYEQNSQNDVILFSVAAATATGQLNPVDMGNFFCPGLSLFLTLNHHIYPSINFELMLDTARQLAEDLGGVLLDETQAVLTPEKVQQIREKIKRYETSQQTMELFV